MKKKFLILIIMSIFAYQCTAIAVGAGSGSSSDNEKKKQGNQTTCMLYFLMSLNSTNTLGSALILIGLAESDVDSCTLGFLLSLMARTSYTSTTTTTSSSYYCRYAGSSYGCGGSSNYACYSSTYGWGYSCYSSSTCYSNCNLQSSGSIKNEEVMKKFCSKPNEFCTLLKQEKM